MHLRVLTVAAAPSGGAIQFVRSLRNVDSTLVAAAGSCSRCCASPARCWPRSSGGCSARQVIQPVTDLTAAAEHITQTEDLGRRIDVPGDDEVGRMAARFNTMLDTLEGSRRALDDSVHAQRQLVADASHELRTPVTSLRTNIEVLLAGGELPDDDRRRLLEDVRAETEELSALITDVIELARGDEPLSGVEEVQLDALVDGGGRARAAPPAERDVRRADLEPTVVEGLPDRLGRAVDNLLDNAGKYSARRDDRRGRAAAAASSACATTARASRPTTGRTSSTASTAARRRAGGRARASAWRSCARSPRRTAAAIARRGGRGRRLALRPDAGAAADGRARARARAGRAARRRAALASLRGGRLATIPARPTARRTLDGLQSSGSSSAKPVRTAPEDADATRAETLAGDGERHVRHRTQKLVAPVADDDVVAAHPRLRPARSPTR